MAALRGQGQVGQSQRLTDGVEQSPAERNLSSQQRSMGRHHTAEMLGEFDAELQAAVADMRHQQQHKMRKTQKYAKELQAFTHQELGQHQQVRAAIRDHQRHTLSHSLDELEDCVADYMRGLSEKRSTKASLGQVPGQSVPDDSFGSSSGLWDDYGAAEQKLPAVRGGSYASVAEKDRAGHRSSKLDILAERAIHDHLKSHSRGVRIADVQTALGISYTQAHEALQSLVHQGHADCKDGIYYIQKPARP